MDEMESLRLVRSLCTSCPLAAAVMVTFSPVRSDLSHPSKTHPALTLTDSMSLPALKCFQKVSFRSVTSAISKGVSQLEPSVLHLGLS